MTRETDTPHPSEALLQRLADFERATRWVGEVMPAKTRSGGALVTLSWEEFNALRELRNLPAKQPHARATSTVRVINGHAYPAASADRLNKLERLASSARRAIETGDTLASGADLAALGELEAQAPYIVRELLDEVARLAAAAAAPAARGESVGTMPAAPCAAAIPRNW